MLSSVYHLLFTDSKKVDKSALVMHLCIFMSVLIAIW